jgi:hypothetical protein
MFFTPPYITSNYGKCPTRVTIPIRDGETLAVTLSSSLCYLNVFFTSKLDWLLYVKLLRASMA